MKKLFLPLFILSIVFASCKKDDTDTVITTTNVTSTVTSGNWRVTYYFDSNQDETINFAGYSFVFNPNGTITAFKAPTVVTGTWAPGNDDSKVKLILNFLSPSNFSELSEDWQVIERTDTRIKLQHISGGNGGTDFLTFEKN
jgi:hypothetical protein